MTTSSSVKVRTPSSSLSKSINTSLRSAKYSLDRGHFSWTVSLHLTCSSLNPSLLFAKNRVSIFIKISFRIYDQIHEWIHETYFRNSGLSLTNSCQDEDDTRWYQVNVDYQVVLLSYVSFSTFHSSDFDGGHWRPSVSNLRSILGLFIWLQRKKYTVGSQCVSVL